MAEELIVMGWRSPIVQVCFFDKVFSALFEIFFQIVKNDISHHFPIASVKVCRKFFIAGQFFVTPIIKAWDVEILDPSE